MDVEAAVDEARYWSWSKLRTTVDFTVDAFSYGKYLRADVRQIRLYAL